MTWKISKLRINDSDIRFSNGTINNLPGKVRGLNLAFKSETFRMDLSSHSFVAVEFDTVDGPSGKGQFDLRTSSIPSGNWRFVSAGKIELNDK